MTELPKALRFSPYAFYALALIMGVYQFLTYLIVDWEAQHAAYTAPHANAFDWFGQLLTTQPFAMGVSEAAYMAANGAIAHVLIAIYDKMEGQSE